jgi:YfiH family protein
MTILVKSKMLSEIGWIEHGFGVGAGDVRDLVDPSAKSFNTKQVHGSAVHVLEDETNDRVLNGDAFVTSKPGLVCHVRTADCVPILIADTKNKMVGAIHAGWEGTAHDVVGHAIKKMRDRFGADPKECIAAIGPCICGCCYEVGEEVVREIGSLNLKCEWKIDASHIDLGQANRELMERAGLISCNIDRLSSCTSCDPRFASWRRDGTDGRQVSYILIN